MVRKSLLDEAFSSRRSTPTASESMPAGNSNRSPVALTL
jgi:hypothetical protein